MNSYRTALEKIVKLGDAKEMKIPFSDCPDHLMAADGFEPIHPMMREGLKIAAKIAKQALEAEEG